MARYVPDAAPPGASDATISAGTLAEQMAISRLDGPRFNEGNVALAAAQSYAVPLAAGSLAGSTSFVEGPGAANRTVGSNALASVPLTAGSVGAQPAGAHGASWSAVGSATAREQAGTGARVDLAPTGGFSTWTSPANAADADADEATITLSTTTLGDATRKSSDRLELTTWSPGGLPAGATAKAVNLEVRHRYLMTLALLDLTSTVTETIRVVYTDATSTVVSTRIQGSGDRAALATDSFDITADVVTAGKTVSAVQCDYVADCSGASVNVTTLTWNVAFAQLRYSYSTATLN